jgi:hypothetical protein
VIPAYTLPAGARYAAASDPDGRTRHIDASASAQSSERRTIPHRDRIRHADLDRRGFRHTTYNDTWVGIPSRPGITPLELSKIVAGSFANPRLVIRNPQATFAVVVRRDQLMEAGNLNGTIFGFVDFVCHQGRARRPRSRLTALSTRAAWRECRDSSYS